MYKNIFRNVKRFLYYRHPNKLKSELKPKYLSTYTTKSVKNIKKLPIIKRKHKIILSDKLKIKNLSKSRLKAYGLN